MKNKKNLSICNLQTLKIRFYTIVKKGENKRNKKKKNFELIKKL